MRLRSESLNKDSLVDFNTESLKSNNGVNNNSNSADNDAHEYLNRHTNFSTKGVKHNERIAPIIEKYTQNMEGMAKVIEETKMENESSCDEDKECYIERMRSIDLTEDRILSTQLMKNHNQEEDQKIEVIKSIPKTINRAQIHREDRVEPVTEPQVNAISLNSTPFSMTTDSMICMIQVNPQEVPQKEENKQKQRKGKFVKRKRNNNKSKLKRNSMLS